jgi:DNA modification methylase
MKPVGLVERAIRNSSKGRDTVLDPFGGSGSTLIACEKAGRQARLIELEPKHCGVICRALLAEVRKEPAELERRIFERNSGTYVRAQECRQREDHVHEELEELAAEVRTGTRRNKR